MLMSVHVQVFVFQSLVFGVLSNEKYPAVGWVYTRSYFIEYYQSYSLQYDATLALQSLYALCLTALPTVFLMVNPQERRTKKYDCIFPKYCSISEFVIV